MCSGTAAKKKHSESESFVYWAEYKCLGVIHICVLVAIVAYISSVSTLRIYFIVLVCINLTCLKTKLQDANGLGLKVVSGKDYCRVVIQYPSNTVSKWVRACLLCQAKFLLDSDLPSHFSFKKQLA